MSASLFEHSAPEQTADVALQSAALAHGISLDPERLALLTGAAGYAQRLSARYSENPKISIFTDVANDLWARNTSFSDRFGATAAELDFVPAVDEGGDLIVGDSSARPERASLFALKGIRGIQNYILLVEAGIIDKPDILFGNTNPEMAIAAERFGLLSDIARRYPGQPDVAHKKMQSLPTLEIYGNFDEVSERVFSEDVKRIDRVLSRRLELRKRAGAMAVSI